MKNINSVSIKAVLLISISAIFFLLSCSSLESKAKKAIKEELRLTMHDFKSYEPVQFGKLEVAMSNYIDAPEVGIYLDKAEDFLNKSSEYLDKADIYDYDKSSTIYLIYFRGGSAYLDSAKIYQEKIETFKRNFVPEVIGWKMQHTLRAKSLGGNFGLNQYEFYLDKECKKVIKTVDLSEE